MSVPFGDLRPSTETIREALLGTWSALLAGDRFVGGASVERFETAWAQYCGTAEAVGVGSGVDAVHLTLRALGIGPGDEVVVPGNAFAGVAEAVVLAGARPRFADVDPRTLLLDDVGLERVLTERTAAAVVVHLYGQMADMDALYATASRAGIALVEDATHAPGASWHGRRAGSVSRAGCFGAGPDSGLGALGDAGVVTTSDSELAETLRALRNHGRPPGSAEHRYLGTSSPLDSLQAEVLALKLTRIDGWIDARARVAARFRDAAEGSRLAVLPETEWGRDAHHTAVLRVPQRRLVRDMFDSLGVETRVHHATPLHLAAPFLPFWSGPLPEVEQAADTVLSLPVSPFLTEDQVERVCHAIGLVDAMLALEGEPGGAAQES